MSSAGHCGRHERYRCAVCESKHPNEYHGDDPPAAAKQISPSVIIEQQAAEIDRLRSRSDTAKTIEREHIMQSEIAALRKQVTELKTEIAGADALLSACKEADYE